MADRLGACNALMLRVIGLFEYLISSLGDCLHVIRLLRLASDLNRHLSSVRASQDLAADHVSLLTLPLRSYEPQDQNQGCMREPACMDLDKLSCRRQASPSGSYCIPAFEGSLVEHHELV